MNTIQYRWWERLYFLMFRVWPNGVVERRLSAIGRDEQTVAALVAEARASGDASRLRAFIEGSRRS